MNINIYDTDVFTLLYYNVNTPDKQIECIINKYNSQIYNIDTDRINMIYTNITNNINISVNCISHSILDWFKCKPHGFNKNNQLFYIILDKTELPTSYAFYIKIQSQLEITRKSECVVYYTSTKTDIYDTIIIKRDIKLGATLLNTIISFKNVYNTFIADKVNFQNLLNNGYNLKPFKRRKLSDTDISDFTNWIKPGDVRNYILRDTLLDWLNKYHNTPVHPYKPDVIESVNDNFNQFVTTKSSQFVNKVVTDLKARFLDNIKIINSGDTIDTIANTTVELMKIATPIINGGILLDRINKIYGTPDLIVRNDFINQILINPKNPVIILNNNCIFSDNYYYCVVDIKFTQLHFKADGNSLLNQTLIPVYKAQQIINNNCLGYIQGYTPGECYILGRKWRHGEYSGNNCYDRYGVINVTQTDSDIADLTEAAIEWRKQLHNTDLSTTIIKPNMSNIHDSPWHGAKKILYEKDSIPQPINSIITIRNKLPLVKNRVEFIIDFETVNDLNDDFSTFPVSGGTYCIYLIGCLCRYIDNGIAKSEFTTFMVDNIGFENELIAITEWTDYMHNMNNAYGETDKQPFIYHWGHAESSLYNSFKTRHQIADNNLNFIDLCKIFKTENIFGESVSSYGLKEIATLMYNNNMITSKWTNNVNGMTSMIYAWNGDKLAKSTGVKLKTIDCIKEIIEYNYIDCKVVAEILSFLRCNF